MANKINYLSPADLHDILRGMAVVCKLYDPVDPDVTFRLDTELEAAVASWKDFAGNSCHFLFSKAGNVILGFDHESPMSPHVTSAETGDFQVWPGIFDQVPASLMDLIKQDPFHDGFDTREVTFCLWNTGKTKEWLKSNTIQFPVRSGASSPDGQTMIFGKIHHFYNDFVNAFEELYRWDLDPDAVTDLLSGDRISMSVVRRLKPNMTTKPAFDWLAEMGFVLDGSAR